MASFRRDRDLPQSGGRLKSNFLLTMLGATFLALRPNGGRTARRRVHDATNGSRGLLNGRSQPEREEAQDALSIADGVGGEESQFA